MSQSCMRRPMATSTRKVSSPKRKALLATNLYTQSRSNPKTACTHFLTWADKPTVRHGRARLLIPARHSLNHGRHSCQMHRGYSKKSNAMEAAFTPRRITIFIAPYPQVDLRKDFPQASGP